MLPADPDAIRHIRQGVGYGKGDGSEGLEFPERHWIGLQKWTNTEMAVTYDVALMPFRSRPGAASVTPIPAQRNGKVADPAAARGVRVAPAYAGGEGVVQVCVFSDRPDVETVCGDVRLVGRACMLSVQKGRVAWAAGVDCRRIAFRGKDLFRSRQAKDLVEV